MTTEQIRAIIEPRKFRSQYDYGVRIYALEILDSVDKAYSGHNFETADSLRIAVNEVKWPRKNNSVIIYNRLLPGRAAERAIRRQEAPSPWFYAFKLQRDAIYRAKRMIRDAAVLFEKEWQGERTKAIMKDGRGISNEFIARVRQEGYLIANENEYEYRGGMVIARYKVAGKKSVEPRVIAVDCPTWLRTSGYIKVWPPKELESGVHRIE